MKVAIHVSAEVCILRLSTGAFTKYERPCNLAKQTKGLRQVQILHLWVLAIDILAVCYSASLKAGHVPADEIRCGYSVPGSRHSSAVIAPKSSTAAAKTSTKRLIF